MALPFGLEKGYAFAKSHVVSVDLACGRRITSLWVPCRLCVRILTFHKHNCLFFFFFYLDALWLFPLGLTPPSPFFFSFFLQLSSSYIFVNRVDCLSGHENKLAERERESELETTLFYKDCSLEEPRTATSTFTQLLSSDSFNFEFSAD